MTPQFTSRSIIATIAAAAFAGASTAQAMHESVPSSGPTKSELRALRLRSEGLNALYRQHGPTGAELRALRLRSEGMNARYGHTGPTGAELRALRLRSEGMNARYGISERGRYAGGPDTRQEDVRRGLRGEGSDLPIGVSPQELRALRLRSEGLNAHYGHTGPSGAELRALRLWSEGMNALYGGSQHSAEASSSAWDDAGFGIAAALGALGLGGLAVRTGRRGRRTRTVTAA